ncbi:MAG: ATPase [Alphaproteobacteria bacterium]|nr:MAG: ATPase [Alphaproteobacteria bacterium]
MTQKPYIIVLGNEKGGTGKSTTAMHIITALLDMGYKVGSIDVDARQGTLTRYCHNREAYQKNHLPSLNLSDHVAIHKSHAPTVSQAKEDDEKNFNQAIADRSDCHIIVIDTPGNDTHLARYAHSYADTLITPMNDSFIDLDVLTNINSETLELTRPSIYAEWVWEQKKQRAIRDKGSIDWIVLRNRLASIHSNNRQRIDEVLAKLSKRLAFRLLEGFSERVIFKELFPKGLTLIDLKKLEQPLTLSQVAARNELRGLMREIKFPDLQEKLASA